ncbi:MAG TPA: hypothetical protein VF721_15225, partial [Pyrinomonadaceae bacterium]
MATAIIKLDKSLGIKSFPKSRRLTVKKISPAATNVNHRAKALKKWIFGLSLALLFCGGLASVAFYYFYSQAAAVVEQRMK